MFRIDEDILTFGDLDGLRKFMQHRMKVDINSINYHTRKYLENEMECHKIAKESSENNLEYCKKIIRKINNTIKKHNAIELYDE